VRSRENGRTGAAQDWSCPDGMSRSAIQAAGDVADEFEAEEEALGGKVDVSQVAAAGMIAITLYLLGMIAYHLVGLPGPVAMLFIAVLVKLTRAVSPELRQAANVVYRFFSTAVTYPLLFASALQ
jgi:malate:Na+ symporter